MKPDLTVYVLEEQQNSAFGDYDECADWNVVGVFTTLEAAHAVHAGEWEHSDADGEEWWEADRWHISPHVVDAPRVTP